MNRQLVSAAAKRVAMLGFVAAVLFTGCLGRTSTAPVRMPATSENAQAGSSPAELGPAAARIISLNSEHGFVVIDFTSRLMPAVGSRVDVYHDGKRVGVVRITEPVRRPFATADILEGEVRVGDEVR